MTAQGEPGRSGAEGAPLRLAIRADAAGLAEAQPRLRAYLDAAGLPGGASDRAELLVEEVVMNVAMHGIDPGEETVVDLLAEAGPATCTLVFEDGGRAFDPTAGELPDRPVSLADAEPGGLGLFLLRRMTSKLTYDRLPQGRNRLRLVIPGDVA